LQLSVGLTQLIAPSDQVNTRGSTKLDENFVKMLAYVRDGQLSQTTLEELQKVLGSGVCGQQTMVNAGRNVPSFASQLQC
jgi:hypothetical protein